MICIFEDDIRRQKDLGEGIQAQTINGLQKLIETYQKFMNVTENKQTFITTFIPEKNYESIISNKVIQTDVMKIEQDTSIKNEEEEGRRMLELNKIYNMDCYTAIKEIADKSVDCIYTDVPYLYCNGGQGHSELSVRTARKKAGISRYK